MIDKIKIHLENRIAELKKADADFCKDRWDMSKPKIERDLYRGFSNEVTFARHELESMLKFLNELSKGDVKSSSLTCKNCNGFFGININHQCYKCLEKMF